MFESKALMPWKPTSKKTAIESNYYYLSYLYYWIDIDEYDEKLNKNKKKRRDDDDDEDR